MSKEALFPGSFDPFTIGHMSIVEQSLRLFDKVVIGIGVNTGKQGLLTIDNRIRLVKEIFNNDPRIDAVVYEGLTGEFCRKMGFDFILRGMRNTVDYEYERNMMLINQKLYPEITTVLLFTPPEFVAISSSTIRELVSFGHDPKEFMPNNIDIRDYL